VTFTKGFEDSDSLNLHFHKHIIKGREFSFSNAVEYQNRADEFLGGKKAPTTLECHRKGGDIVRYDKATEEFGILSRLGHIVSFYKADPKRHSFRDNVEYWKRECRRVFLANGDSVFI
jgi:hypothetical protein